VAIDLVREEIISRELAMSWVGVDDPAAEMARIAAESKQRGAQPEGAADEIDSLFGEETATERQTNTQNGALPETEA
jgi:hypothetical protein